MYYFMFKFQMEISIFNEIALYQQNLPSWSISHYSHCCNTEVSPIVYIDGLVQACGISIALAMEILQSCTKPLIYMCVFIVTSMKTKIFYCSNCLVVVYFRINCCCCIIFSTRACFTYLENILVTACVSYIQVMSWHREFVSGTVSTGCNTIIIR